MPIESAKVPDQEVPNWIKALREGGFTDNEIDSTISALNVEYSKASGIDPIETELRRIEKKLQEKHGRILSKDQRDHLRQSISDRPEFKDFKDKK